MIQNYLKTLLFEHDCVILPEFGGFITQYVSAEIHPITHKFLPPSKRVAFNEQLKNNDFLLAKAVSEGESISLEESLKAIAAFVAEIRDSLANKGNYDLKDIGRFFLNEEKNLQFDPDITQNYFEDSYSLPVLLFKPIDRTNNSMNKVQRPVKKNEVSNEEYINQNDQEKKINVAKFLVPAFLFLLLGGAAFMYFNQENQNLASVNPFVIFGEKKEIEVKTEEPKIEKASVASAEDMGTSESAMDDSGFSSDNDGISVQKERYFIVAGSFKSRENAQKLRDQLEEKKDIQATILEPGGQGEFYRVSLADFDSKDDASAKLKELKSSFGKKIWILTY